MFSRVILGWAAASAALFLSAPASAQDLTQTYTVSTVVDLAHIMTVNTYAVGGGSTNSFAVNAPGGVIVDPFLKSSLNPPLLTYFLGVWTDVSTIEHLVLALDSGYAASVLTAGDDFSVTFGGYTEDSLIDALILLDTPDLAVGDPGQPAQAAAKDAAYTLLGDFSDLVNGQGGFTAASGGTFSLVGYSTPSLVGDGVTALVPLAAAVPEPATWAMMLGGFGLIGFTIRRRNRRGAEALAA